jgi:hypothetical protein
MPLPKRKLNTGKRMSCSGRRCPMKRNWIKTPAASTLKNDVLCGLVLNIEKMMTKFNKSIVITISLMILLTESRFLLISGTCRIFLRARECIGPAKRE